jgi:F420-dependent oxidoreductase-like protein
LKIAIMIEGQNGLTWPRWQVLAQTVERLGFSGLFRSDHFTNAQPPDQDSLELWISLSWLASATRQIEFGPLVSPLSFRHPALTARMAAAVDDLSGGRLSLGLGAGWQEREHRLYGFDLLDLPQRFVRFQEGLEVITRLLRSDQPVSFPGRYFQLQQASLLPRPARPGGPRLLVGGNGIARTLPLAARYADEWNAIFATPEQFARLSARLDQLLRLNSRGPEAVQRSMMTGVRFGRSRRELEGRLATGKVSWQALRARGILVGTGDEIRLQLADLEKAGLQRIMLQWLDLDDLDGLSDLAKAVL